MTLPERLAENIRQLRAMRGKTQDQMAKLAGLPRATWAHLESGSANPTLGVIHAAASALGISLEELLAPPRPSAQLVPREQLVHKQRGAVIIRKLLPEPLPGMDIDRMELPAGARMTGTPHLPGTREFLTCERGAIVLIASGERFELRAGDLVTFRGDQKHSYHNVTDSIAVGYSVVLRVGASSPP